MVLGSSSGMGRGNSSISSNKYTTGTPQIEHDFSWSVYSNSSRVGVSSSPSSSSSDSIQKLIVVLVVE